MRAFWPRVACHGRRHPCQLVWQVDIAGDKAVSLSGPRSFVPTKLALQTAKSIGDTHGCKAQYPPAAFGVSLSPALSCTSIAGTLHYAP